MTNDELKLIIEQIKQDRHTDADLEKLCQALINNDNAQVSLQLGKFNVNISEGKNIHIGDRIYQQWNEEVIETLVKAIQATNTINQDNSGQGDNIGRDKNETNNYNNCTFIQLLAQGNNLVKK